MKKQIAHTILSAGILILVGVGCGGASAPPTDSTTTTDAVIKAPSTALAAQQAALRTRPERACESRGFTIVARFNDDLDETLQYCQFSDGSECELLEFYNGICGPGEGAAVLTNPNLQTDPFVESTCDDSNPPVCGVNGHSYINTCIAAQAGIAIAHEGMCTAEEIAANSPALEQSTSKRSNVITRAKETISNKLPSNDEQVNEDVPPPTPDPEVPTQGSNPEWLEMVIALIEAQPVREPRMYIDLCPRGSDDIAYFETNGTDAVASTLYNQNGAIICNPNRDFAGVCPNTVSYNSCSRIYTDER